MARVERKHEILSEPLTDAFLRSRSEEGWKPAAVVWERTVEGEEGLAASAPVPFGLRIADDRNQLEADSGELDAMVLMLRLIVDETPFSDIAAELNGRGFLTRAGTEWNQTTVFHMLPRLIEAAPSIYTSEEWQALRPRRRAAI